jgi:hypothetical protein
MGVNPFVNPVVHENIRAAEMMSRREYLAVSNVQAWERMVSRAKTLVEADVSHIEVLIANAIELGRAKRALEDL